MIVPVLSRTTRSMFPAASMVAAFLNRIPCLAALPVPTMIASGVASPRAQGQDITSTETITVTENDTLLPERNHRAQHAAAMSSTVGTNTPATRSAMRAMGALVPWAPSIIDTI